jgi:6-phosphofructokinase 1
MASRKPARKNAFYAQSGGVTAVINASAAGVIETARAHRDTIGTVYAGRNGIIGALTEDLIDTGKESAAAIRALRSTPSGAFGSCRYKLKSLETNRREYERLIEVFKAHDIAWFFYNGGGDSADTCFKVSQLSASMGYRCRRSTCRRRSTTTCRSPTAARASARWPSTWRCRRSRPRSTCARWPAPRPRCSCSR